MPLVDLNFGLSAQALCILRLLADVDESEVAEWDEEMHFALIETNTRPWYNGREKGFYLEVKHPTLSRRGENYLHICFAEHKVTDDVIVHVWVGDAFEGSIFVGGVPDDAYLNAKAFKKGQFMDVVEFIKNSMRSYLESITVITPVIDS